MTPRSSVKRTWAADLVHPVPLAAVGVLALNDHVFKGSGLLPAVVTGKLSDFAGLFFFPLLLAAVARGVSCAARGRDIEARRSLAAAVAIVTAVGFAAVKLVPAVNALAALTWGRMVMDATDLIALPAVGLAAAWMLRATLTRAPTVASRPPRDLSSRLLRALDFAAVVVTAIACIASTPASHQERASAAHSAGADDEEEDEAPLDPAQVKQGELAQKLLLIELQTETIEPLFTGNEDLKAQYAKLLEHIAATSKILEHANAEPVAMRAAEVGIDLAGLTHDLMRANREAWSRSLPNRKEIEAEVNFALYHYTWPGMNKLAAAQAWPTEAPAEADELIAKAASHRDNVLAAAAVASVMKVGVQAASIMNLAVTIPRSVVAGYRALGRLGEWMGKLQIETASLQFAGVPGGVGTFQLVSSAEVLTLGFREVRYLAEAGKISVTALDLYVMSQGAGGGTKPSNQSRILGRALEKAGKVRPPGKWAAHHIVAWNAEKAKPAQAILDKFGIGINEAENGVFLDKAVHDALHTNKYYDAVNKALQGCTTKQAVIETLQEIANKLANGTFP